MKTEEEPDFNEKLQFINFDFSLLLFWLLCFETEAHCIAQAGLELAILLP
jgi:hypothetical protein